MIIFYRNDWALVPMMDAEASFDEPLPSRTIQVFALARALFESGQAPSFDAAVLSILKGPSLPVFASGDDTLLSLPEVTSGCNCGLRCDDDAMYCRCDRDDGDDPDDDDFDGCDTCDFEYPTDDEEA